MVGSTLASTLLLLASLVYCDGAAPNEPPFPKLLDGTNPNRHRIHITSERLYPDGGYKAAEEFVDLDLGKAAYITTSNNVRETWLVNIKDRSNYKYRPFTCERSEYTGKTDEMILYDISDKLEMFSHSPSKEYSKIAGQKSGHKWSLVSGSKTIHIRFSESVNRTGELVLNSIEEYEGGSKKLTINILSVEHELPAEAYNNELQLPLIYGCKRDAESLDVEMLKKFDIITDALIDRHHFKAKARAMKFVTTNPITTESINIEMALSYLHDAHHEMSPVKAHMIRRRDNQGDIKTVVDHYLNVKYETNMTNGTCTVSNVGPFDADDEDESVSFVLQFSDELALSINAKVLEGMLYKISKESFMKLEQRDDSTQYAYFACTYYDVFGPRTMARVVRKFSLDTDGRAKLDSFAIWLFESATKIREVYDFKILDTKSLVSDVNSAQAFDQSRECYLNSEEALEGLDYAWFKLDFTLPPGRVDALRNRVDELKNTFYRLIRTNLSLSYLRVPKMEVIFSPDPGSIAIKMLVLDLVPLHLILDKLKAQYLYSDYVSTSKVVTSLEDCSEFCWKKQCSGMTFNRVDHTCSLIIGGIVFRNYLGTDENADTYWIPEDKEPYLLPRLQQQTDALHPSRQDVGEILGFNELNQVNPTGNLLGFRNLRALLELDGQKVALAPVSVQVVSEPEGADDAEPEKMIFDETAT